MLGLWLEVAPPADAGWVPAGPAGADGWVEIAVGAPESEGGPPRLALVDGDGTVVWSADGGATWVDAGLEPLPYAAEPSGIDEVIDALREASESFDLDGAAEATSRLGEIEITAAGDGAAAVWDGAALWVGRPDGLWRYEDGSWARELALDVRSLAVREGVVVGISDGVPWRSATGAPGWTAPAVANMGALAVRSGPDGFLVGASGGLWYSADGASWSLAGDVDGPVFDLAFDPYAPFSAWIAGNGVRRTTDLGQTVVVGGGAALDVRRVVALGERAAAVAGRDGVWRTTDGGWNWVPLNGLAGADVRALASYGDQLWAAGSGLWRWEDEVLAADLPAPPAWIGVDDVIAGALRRPGTTPPVGNPWSATFLPDLTATGTWSTGDSLLWVPDAGTTRNVSSSWSIGVVLTWAPPSRRVEADLSGGDIDATIESLEDLRGNPELRRDLRLDVERDPAAVALAVGRQEVEARQALVLEVAQLWAVRQTLAAEPRRTEVVHEVARQLRLAEVMARLDALTGGLITRYELSSRVAGGER
jgi:hypothetical protein